MSKAKKYSIPKRVDKALEPLPVWHSYSTATKSEIVFKVDKKLLRRLMIRLMREAYKKSREKERQASHQECQAAYDAGLMAGRREK